MYVHTHMYVYTQYIHTYIYIYIYQQMMKEERRKSSSLIKCNMHNNFLPYLTKEYNYFSQCLS